MNDDAPKQRSSPLLRACCGLLLVGLLGAAVLAGLLLGHAREAEPVVDGYARLLEAGSFQAAYQGSHALLRQSTDLAGFEAAIGAAQRRLGKLQSRKTTSVDSHTGSDGTRITITYDATWTNGAGTLTVVLMREGDQLKVAGWHMTSPALQAAPAASPGASPAPSSSAPSQKTAPVGD
ncbi:MAG: DUF4019 domain-containing protein [Planctomycetota bacterium]